MTCMLEDGTYGKLKKDPTTAVESRVTKVLRRWEREEHINRKFRLRLQPQCSAPPQLYGLPKIHKQGAPLRPIVSAIGSPTYDIAKFLTKIISPLTGKSDSFIKNSSDFAERVRNTVLNASDKMVSFDVVSLFTRVPVPEAIDVISHRLEQDESLDERTSLPPSEICQAIELCLHSTYFQFEDSFFEQREGAAMGSPLSPAIANIFMESLEERALKTITQRPSMWIRYVDDTFVIWPHGDDELERFHQHLNQQNQSIKFTIEEEKDNQLPFLDVLVRRDGNHLRTTVYRKPTHTDRYINFNSHHHSRVLRGTIQCLRDRALNVCDTTSRAAELKHLHDVFAMNGYPKKLTRRTLKQRPGRKPEQEEDETPDKEGKKQLFIPYIKGVSEKIERICHPLGVQVICKSRNNLRQSLMKVKSTRPDELKKGVVYEVPCADCECVYIGETGRSLEMRLKEHRYAVKTKDSRNGIAVHADTHNHEVDWQAAKVLMFEEHLTKRKVLESLHINKQTNTTNLDNGYTLSPIWKPLLT